MQRDVLGFWVAHGPDQEYGGFHGALDQQVVVPPHAPGSPVLHILQTLMHSLGCMAHGLS